MLVVFIGFCQVLMAQQIATNNNLSLEALIQSTLGEGCVEISNISSAINGSKFGISSYGLFTKEKSNFPFKNGLVLTSGNVRSAGNAMDTNVLSEGTESWGTDPDLEAALGITSTMNATSIEFDFRSAANQIAFNYLLASEEYLSGNACNYSDGFAFLIKEAGSSKPYRNIAVIPGTSTPVNTMTIHPEIVGLCPAENASYFEGFNLGDTNYNGRTKVLTATATIKPNVDYHIKLVIADQRDPFYDSAVFIEGNSFDAKVDLGPDITTCATSTILNGSIDNPLATYQWFRNGALIPNANKATIKVDASGNYKVKVELRLEKRTCVLEDTIVVILNASTVMESLPDFVLCDDVSNDGREIFNLTSLRDVVLSHLPESNYSITYHGTEEQAQSGELGLSDEFESGFEPTTIFIRIRDVANGCLSYTKVRLILNPLPPVPVLEPLIACDTDGTPDGITKIDLAALDDQITNGIEKLFVTYHYNSIDANTGDNAIPSPFTNTNPEHTLFVRIYNAETGCHSNTTLEVQVVPLPEVAITRPYINACQPEDIEFETFDLTSAITELLPNLPGIADGFYETLEDAEAAKNPIANPTNYQNIIPSFQSVYIRVLDEASNCATIVPIELHTNIAFTGLNTNDFNGCDDPSNDGIVDFDLEEVAKTIVSGYTGFEVDFYENEEDQKNGKNVLSIKKPYTVNASPKQIFATVISDGCTEFIPINLIINPPILLPPLDPVLYCDTDQDGNVDVILKTFDSHVSNGINGVNVKYYTTEDDALEDENILAPIMYVKNSEIVYVRVTNPLTSCFDVAPLTIQIVTPPEIAGVVEVVVCDDDSDGYAIINLEEKIPDLITDTTGLKITFHDTYELAKSGEEKILEPSQHHMASQDIFVRIENESTGCFSIGNINVHVNVLPQFPVISNFKNCEAAEIQTTDFYFYEKDVEILNGQLNKEVFYFKTLKDAEKHQNNIDKFTAYQHDPKADDTTIYVRVEAATDQECYGISSFELEVGSLPAYNAPTDIFVCDEASNDGILTLDLSDKISEISMGINEVLAIKLFTSLEDVTMGNPIEDITKYRNTVNPQPIYAQIDNGTSCYALTKFSINVVSLPEVTLPSNLTACDINKDGTVTFDLSVVEIDVLDIRQDNIKVTYHESLEGAENDNQKIPNPKNYQNISNPQTVYIKINNTVSNCYVNLPINLKATLPPSVIDFKSYAICPNPDQSFDLRTIQPLVTSESGIGFSFHKSEADAKDNVDPFNTNYNYTTPNDRIYVRLENKKTGCLSYYDFRLMVLASPVIHTPPDLEDCDDDFDGRLVFDLSLQTKKILGNQPAAQYSLSYHNSPENADSGKKPLDSLYNAKNKEIIYVRVENTATGCFSTEKFSIQIHPKPIVDIPNQTLCIDNAPLYVNASTNNPTDTYLWSTGATTADIEISAIGFYSVTVTSDLGCETTRDFEVIQSESATIDATETVDFSDPNNITITIRGIGDYLYVLDDGPPQESNVFENVTLGNHTVKIIDLNGCAETTKDVVVIDAPKFMTPNNDGFFDTWHISGIETLPGSIVYIFDRYGKLITTLTSTSQGWDGRYNGHLLPSTDYWYYGKIKKNDNVFEVKGHFALKL